MDLVGHTRQKDALMRDLETGNVAHAYLFVGPAHIGKFTLAKWFAEQLLLEGVPDDQTQQMRHMIEKLLHPDLLVLDELWIEDQREDWNQIALSSNVSQDHRKKAGARSDRISIDDVRTLQERIFETASGKYRCICIADIERMDDPPANALLKILEEPPPGRVFLLTTQSTAALLPTVISRCRVIQCAPVPPKEVAPMLKGVQEDDVPFLLHVSQGAPGLVKQFMKDPDLLRAERMMHTQALSFWRTKNLFERMRLLEPMHERTPEGDRFVLHLALALRELTPTEPRYERSLRGFVEAMQTNVHRPLLASEFALSLS